MPIVRQAAVVKKEAESQIWHILNQDVGGKKEIIAQVPKSQIDTIQAQWINCQDEPNSYKSSSKCPSHLPIRRVCLLTHCEAIFAVDFSPFSILSMGITFAAPSSPQSKAPDSAGTCTAEGIHTSGVTVSLGMYSTDISTVLTRLIHLSGQYIAHRHQPRPTPVLLSNCRSSLQEDGSVVFTVDSNTIVRSVLIARVVKQQEAGKDKWMLTEVKIETDRIVVKDDI